MRNIFLWAIIFFAFSGCTQKFSGQSQQTTRSPFEDHKVLLSHGLLNKLSIDSKGAVSSETIIPLGTTFEFIVDDICVHDRLEEDLPVRYLIDSHIEPDQLTLDEEKVHESVLQISLEKETTIGTLNEYARVDPCVIGIADQIKLNVQPTSFNDTAFGSQDYLKKIGFEKAMLFLSKNIDPDIRVRVAVIDSGYDIGSPEQGLLSPHMEGSDYIDFDDHPQDTLGHGTEVANILVAKSNNSNGIAGLGDSYIELLPIRYFGGKRSKTTSSRDFFRALKRSVNMGADIINMSFSAIVDREFNPSSSYEEKREQDKDLNCSPVIGHAIFRAIERNTFLTMSAGHGVLYQKENGEWAYFKQDIKTGKFIRDAGGQLVRCEKATDEYACVRNQIPGPINSPKDNAPVYFGNTSVPACWARYYKGAIAVAALNEDSKIADFSNSGIDAVELAAPGKGIKTVSLNNELVTKNGTSYSASMAAGGAAMIIAFFKQKQKEAKLAGDDSREWYYSPWMVEDILLNGSRVLEELSSTKVKYELSEEMVWNGERYPLNAVPEGEKAVRLSKSLHLGDLSDYLLHISGLSFDERRRQETDNKEEGRGFDPQLSEEDGVELIGIQAYTEKAIFRNLDRLQVQAVAYFSNGSSKVITNEVSWKSSSPDEVPIDNQGVAYPDYEFQGAAEFTANYRGVASTSHSVFIVDRNVVTGENTLVPTELRLVIEKKPGQFVDARITTKVLASFANGRTRDVTEYASISTSDSRLYYPGYFAGSFNRQSKALPGEKVIFTAFYYGVKAQVEHTLQHYEYMGEQEILYSANVYPEIQAQATFNPPPQGGLVYDAGMVKLTEDQFGKKHSTQFGLKASLKFQVEQDDGSLFEAYVGSVQYTFATPQTAPEEGLHEKTITGDPFYWSNKPAESISIKFQVEFQYEKIRLVDFELRNHLNHIFTHVAPFGPGQTEIPESYQEGEVIHTIHGNPSPFIRRYPFKVVGLYSDGSEHDLGFEGFINDSSGLPLKRSYERKASGLLGLVIYENQIGDLLELSIKSAGITKKYPLKTHGAKKMHFGNITSRRTFTREVFKEGFSLNENTTIFTNSVTNNKLRDPLCDELGKLDYPKLDDQETLLVCNIRQFVALGNKHAGRVKLLNHLDFLELNEEFEKTISISYLDGNGYEFRNYVAVGTEKEIVPLMIVSVETKNIGFRNVYLRTKKNSIAYLGIHATNIYLVDSSIENDQFAVPFSSKSRFKGAFVVNTSIRSLTNNAMALSEGGSFKDIYMNVSIRADNRASPLGINALGMHGCEKDFVIEHFDCDGMNTNILLEGSVQALHGSASGVGANNLAHAKTYMSVQSGGDSVGGISPGFGARDYSYSPIYDVHVEADIRGRDRVGGLFGSMDGGMVENVSYKGLVRGSEYVGGLVGQVRHGYQSFRNIDLSEARAESTGRYVSDFIGHLDNHIVENRFDGNGVDFHTPMLVENVDYKGSFLGENQKELAEVMSAIIANQ